LFLGEGIVISQKAPTSTRAEGPVGFFNSNLLAAERFGPFSVCEWSKPRTGLAVQLTLGGRICFFQIIIVRASVGGRFGGIELVDEWGEAVRQLGDFDGPVIHPSNVDVWKW